MWMVIQITSAGPLPLSLAPEDTGLVTLGQAAKCLEGRSENA